MIIFLKNGIIVAYLNNELFNWNDDSCSDCYNNDWLYKSSNWQWTISPFASSSFANHVFIVNHTGDVGDRAYYAGMVRPSVYLISKTSILGGEGTLENPYEIG